MGTLGAIIFAEQSLRVWLYAPGNTVCETQQDAGFAVYGAIFGGHPNNSSGRAVLRGIVQKVRYDPMNQGTICHQGLDRGTLHDKSVPGQMFTSLLLEDCRYVDTFISIQ